MYNTKETQAEESTALMNYVGALELLAIHLKQAGFTSHRWKRAIRLLEHYVEYDQYKHELWQRSNLNQWMAAPPFIIANDSGRKQRMNQQLFRLKQAIHLSPTPLTPILAVPARPWLSRKAKSMFRKDGEFRDK